jgi:hypothetical protein
MPHRVRSHTRKTDHYRPRLKGGHTLKPTSGRGSLLLLSFADVMAIVQYAKAKISSIV